MKPSLASTAGVAAAAALVTTAARSQHQVTSASQVINPALLGHLEISQQTYMDELMKIHLSQKQPEQGFQQVP